MKISDRLTNLTPSGSDGWEIIYETDRLRRAGQEIIALTVGEHDVPTNPRILNAMHQSAVNGATGYTAVGGLPVLRSAIAARISRRTGVETGPQNILVTPGGQAALFAAHMAVLDPNDEALYISPSYATYPGTIRAAGGHPVEVHSDPNTGFPPPIQAIEEATQKARSLLINTPNNPTGTVYDASALAKLGKLCKERDLWLISDEVYDTMIWSGNFISARQECDPERTLIVGSMSKSHAMTGSRIGWLCGPAELIAHLENLATHTTYGLPAYIQDAAIAGFELGTEFEKEVAAPFLRRREIALAQFDELQLLKVIPPQSGMYVMVDIRETGLCGQQFATQLLHQYSVAVMPGESFGASAAGHIRIALTAKDDLLREAIARIGEFVSKLERTKIGAK